jgi:anti-sigma regulatory factor (Ser/Thr protein kinase)
MNIELTQEILKFAEKEKQFQVNSVRKYLKEKYSRQHISVSLNILVKDNKLIRSGANRHTFYALPGNIDVFASVISRKLKNKNLSEEKVLISLREEALFKNKMSDNLKSVFEYAFSEMLNNAIEHSRSKTISISVKVLNGDLEFEIRDFGIGVFRNIIGKLKLKSELEAIQELMKGKTTTQPKAHSGEGIFFTSKVADVFSMDSYGYRLIVNNKVKDIFIEKPDEIISGTKIVFTISMDSKKHLSAIFSEYQSDPETFAFDKTDIIVKLYTFGTVHISR